MAQSEEQATADEARWIEAMQWLEELRECNESALTHGRFHAWREWVAHPENRRVFTELSEILADSRLLGSLHLPGLSATGHPVQEKAPATPVEPLSLNVTVASKTNRFSRGARVAFLTAAAAVVVCGGFLLTSRVLPFVERTDVRLSRAQVEETGQAEVRTLSLPDGSTVTLGARSSIAVQFERERRSVRLDRGEAWFRVAHDPLRPFVVYAAHGMITAVGTAFVVQRDDDHVVVTVTDGAVQVVPAPTDGTSSFLTTILSRVRQGTARVVRGEQISYEDSGSATPVERADPDAATAWSQGRLEFDHTPLGQVIAEVNRYSRRSIHLDPAVGEPDFTGLVLAEEIDNWICGLEDLYPVSIVEEGERVVVRPRLPGTARPTSRCAPFTDAPK